MSASPVLFHGRAATSLRFRDHQNPGFPEDDAARLSTFPSSVTRETEGDRSRRDDLLPSDDDGTTVAAGSSICGCTVVLVGVILLNG